MPKKSSKDTKKFLTSATLAGSLLLSSGSQNLKALPDKPAALRAPLGLITSQELKKLLLDLLNKVLPKSSRVLTNKEEKKLENSIKKTLGVKAVASLDGNRLNHQIGLMGLEQHLMRYPGDTSTNNRSFPQAGVAPGKAAWGFWAGNKSALSKKDIQMEQYYIAAQTLYLPNWKKDLRELRGWYKYRKVIVINPSNGDAVIAVIADAGPAKWTGKKFGGSPQVMHDLGYYPKATKGKTIVLFVDDPQDRIPLGPINYPYTAKFPKQV